MENKIDEVNKIFGIISAEKIIEVVCDALQLPIELFFSKGRKREIVRARHISSRIILEDCSFNMSLKSIGEALMPSDPFDHTTIIHNIKTCKDDCDTNQEYNYLFLLCKRRVQEAKMPPMPFTSMGYSPLYNKQQLCSQTSQF